jgi:hypothetical protein
MQKNPIYELSAILDVSIDFGSFLVSQILTIQAVNLVLSCECGQVCHEKQIEEELDIRGLFIMFELGILEQSLIMSVNRSLVWMIALLRLSLYFIRIRR